MKNFKCLIVCAFMMLFSCSTEETFYHDQVDAANSFSKESLPLPVNNSNPYDWVGERYRETFEQYVKVGDYASKEQLEATVNKDFLEDNNLLGKQTAPSAYQSYKEDSNTNDPWQTLQNIIANSGLTPAAQASLLDFIDAILVIQGDGYGVLYDYIIGYESLVVEDISFTERDKQVILNFTSLVRHGSYSYSTLTVTTETEPDDDWNNAIGNLIGYMEIALAENP